MRRVDIAKIKVEIKRMSEAIKELETDQPNVDDYGYAGGKFTGAVKRASMDLSRALVKIRHYHQG